MPRPGRERSTLVISALEWHAVEQSVQSEADLIVVDLDDLVAPDHKVQARCNAVRALQEIDWKTRTKAVRVNALNTHYGYSDLTEVVRGAKGSLDLLIIPKVDCAADVKFVDSLLSQLEQDQLFAHRIQLEVQIETARGLLNVGEIAFASSRIEALVFGPGDYAASMRFPIEAQAEEQSSSLALTVTRGLFAQHQIAMAGRAAGLRVLDGPYGYINDLEGFARCCSEAHAMGYDGKWCLDLHQVVIANGAFLPTPVQIQYSQEIVDAYAQATTSQQSAVYFKGRLIDTAMIKSANDTLDEARHAKLK